MLLLFTVCFTLRAESEVDATELVRRSHKKMRGETSIVTMTMKVIRPDWTRTVTMKAWSRGHAYSLIRITAPAKEAGQVFLKRETEMWHWIPSIGRMIKLPPSMMGQSWMGSDYTNDDLLKEASVVVDYTHEISGSDTIDGMHCYRVTLTPKTGAAVVWGKVLMWIGSKEYLQVRIEQYDEEMELVNRETLSKIQKIGGRRIPTYMEVVPVRKDGHKTTLSIEEAKFNTELPETFFSQQNMKRVR